jgi:Tol biopolymer transport system component
MCSPGPPGRYVVNSDGSGTQRLKSSRTRGYTDPSWSPDRATIAFAILRFRSKAIAVASGDQSG